MAVRTKPGFKFSIEMLKGPALALGVVLLLAGVGAWMINGFDTPTRILLAVGVLLVGVFVAIEPEDVWRRITSPGALYSGNTLLLGAIVVGILALLNVVGNNRHQRWDLTANKQFSLSEQTLKVLTDLPQPVQATAFYQTDAKQEAEDLLREYETRSNGKVSVEFVDPDQEPARAQQAGIKEYGTTVLTMGDRTQSVSGSRESDFTTGLLRLINPTQKKIYFTTGHNERKVDTADRDSYGQMRTSLQSDNYVVDTLVLAGGQPVPDDAAVVVIAQPRNPFSDEEKQAISQYLDNGGKLMILTQPNLPPAQLQVPLSDLVSRWKVEIGSAPVAEGNPQLSLPREPTVPIVARYPVHKITEGLGFTFFPTVTYITVPQDTGDATITALLQTSDRSWAETGLPQVNFDEGVDPKGPLTIAVAIDAKPVNAPPPGAEDQAEKKTRVVIFGDADFVANDAMQVSSANRDLFLNAVNWLAEEEELISIRPKTQDTRSMFLSSSQTNLVLVTCVVFLPLLVLAAGGFVWWSRR
jgi:gliding motility-associatede transport system auxiliary component